MCVLEKNKIFTWIVSNTCLGVQLKVNTNCVVGAMLTRKLHPGQFPGWSNPGPCVFILAEPEQMDRTLNQTGNAPWNNRQRSRSPRLAQLFPSESSEMWKAAPAVSAWSGSTGVVRTVFLEAFFKNFTFVKTNWKEDGGQWHVHSALHMVREAITMPCEGFQYVHPASDKH